MERFYRNRRRNFFRGLADKRASGVSGYSPAVYERAATRIMRLMVAAGSRRRDRIAGHRRFMRQYSGRN